MGDILEKAFLPGSFARPGPGGESGSGKRELFRCENGQQPLKIAFCSSKIKRLWDRFLN